MTELNYRSRNRNSHAIGAAWIMLLVLGIIYCLGGLLIAGFFALLIVFVGPAFSGGPPNWFTFDNLITGLVLAFVIGSGVAEIIAASGVRRQSHGAISLGIIVAVSNALLALALLIFILASRGPIDRFILFIMSVFVALIAANAGTVWLLVRAGKDLRR